ncbi:TIGR02391 family protein [Enterococcus hulanensis]|uniref:TIGR02391 family protein n=1 Tax=Enterococcus hulanensis TaxID=2559929 RepID=UPI001A9046F1|nr:TIGR02391 family protein [Enterococcus hulanensis]MBO0456320.1 TIGR02391 family protein [Enterococcus hulanensis]
MTKALDATAIKEISMVLGEYTKGSELTKLFFRLNYYDHDSLSPNSKLSTKWRRIENTLLEECRKKKSSKPVFTLCQQILNPAAFIKTPDIWNTARQEVNGILLFYGYQLNDLGKIELSEKVSSFTEAQKRLMSFEKKIAFHEIHPEVSKYCREELFFEDYFHAILEASKGILERIRHISQVEKDGSSLIEEVFIVKRPIILIKGNMLNTLTERSEYNGLKSLLNTIVYMYRNPQAHEPKLYNPKSETDAITAFTLMSLAHRILDNCVNVRDL